jgi:bacillolysin
MKKHYYFFGLLVTLLIFAGIPASQQSNIALTQDFQKNVKKINKSGWVFFKEKFKVDPKRFFMDYKKEFMLSGDDEMKLVKEGEDSLYKFYRFDRYYKGILVEGSGYTLKFKNNYLELSIGRTPFEINIDMANLLDKDIALKEAIKSTKGKKFAWEDKKYESLIKRERNDSSATWLPEGKLIITKTTNGNRRLAYIYEILSIEPKFHYSIQYIDALNGNFIKEIPLIYNGVGITNYNGEQNIATYHIYGTHRLQDQTRGILSAKMNQFSTELDWDNFNFLYDYDDYWDYESERPAISALWATQKSYDYFHTRFGRHGINNANRTINITANYPYFQAGFVYYPSLAHDYLYFGYDGSNSLAALDVVGHEYMHGVTTYLKNLEYSPQESGALNESFSDFFGECIENYVKSSCDWLCGADFDTQRSMISPNDYLQPDYYGGTYWYSGLNTDTYVHTNSGVPNRMFYLMTHGDANLGINGIGQTVASYIAYTSLGWYLDVDATFEEARNAFLDCSLLYGNECSSVYKDIRNAWAAVGVGEPSPEPCFDVSDIYINTNTPDCNAQYPTELCVDVSGGTGNYTYEWRVNSETVSTDRCFWYYYTMEQSGSFYVEAYVSDGELNVHRVTYVEINCGDYLMAKGDSISLSVYPNPVIDLSTIKITENKNFIENANSLYEISIYDWRGQKFYETKSNSSEIKLNMQGFQKGSYLLVVRKGKYKATSQIIKQ